MKRQSNHGFQLILIIEPFGEPRTFPSGWDLSGCQCRQAYWPTLPDGGYALHDPPAAVAWHSEKFASREPSPSGGTFRLL